MKDLPALPERLPTLALRDLVFFPSMVLPLLVGRPRSVAALEEAVAEGGGDHLLLLTQRDPKSEDPTGVDLHRVGTVVRVVQSSRLSDGTSRVVFEGVARARVRRFLPGPGPLRAEIDSFPYSDLESAAANPDFRAALRRAERTFREYVHLHPELAAEIANQLAEVEAPLRLAHLIAGHTLLHTSEKQEIIETEGIEATFRRLQELLERETHVLQIEDKLNQEMRQRMDDDRRKHYLHEQLKAIQKELGGAGSEWGDMEAQIAAAPLPDAARERIEMEFGRLQKMNPAAPEAAVIRSYIEWIVALPWDTRSEDNADVAHARRTLEEAHFGLEEVKDRILDHIAVLSLVKKMQGPILCLVGPPGVGKTSLGKSIARSLNRGFVRVALGGVRDEAEIRGHRRTYVGSLPGRILQGIRRAGSRNPVFLLDEVDKLTKDGHGDPSAALLEVLDPEQNRAFQDHYLELDFDLSEVLFVATANTMAGIPEPLRDRMEIIRIPGYLDTEKRAIARDFLIPEQLRRHGLAPEQVQIPTSVVDRIVEEYTREAGVRELDRLLARVGRKLARRLAEGQSREGERVEITRDDLRELLGPIRYTRTGPDDVLDRVGIATGLAWTSVGGEVLEVEVAAVPGNGAIQLTGTLGDVMKESAVAAVTYARSRARELGLRMLFHQEMDLHVHIPEGATPKDGPSAGVTIAAALVSALTGIPTRGEVAMTGEITLRGRVLPVGGIKEKAVAALRSGITTVILPKGNAVDLETLPAEVRERVTFRTVERMDEALDLVLTNYPGILRESLDSTTDSGVQLSQ